MHSLLPVLAHTIVRPRAHNDPQIIIANTFNAGEWVVGMLHEKVVGQGRVKEE